MITTRTLNPLLQAIAIVGLAASLGAAEIGKPAPGFTGTDIRGQTHQLSDYRGKVVVLEAYNLDCPFCANHFKTGAMQELQKDLTEQGVVWLLINSVNSSHPSHRTREQARAEWDKMKIQATAWIDDSSGTIGRAYDLRTTPHMIVIDQNGVLAYDGAIDDRPSSDGDPRTARNYVREAVTALLAGEPVATPRTKPYGCGVKYGE